MGRKTIAIRVGPAVAIAAVLAITALASIAMAGQRGQVGGPPTIALGSPDEGKRTTPDVVIGRGDTFGGPVELVAYGWLAPHDAIPSSPRKQFCVWIEYLPDEVSHGTCNRALDLSYEGKVVVDSQVQAPGPPGRGYTEIGGRLAPGVASVQVVYPAGSHNLSVVNATVAQVAGSLQRKLHQPAPFGYFDAKIPGLVRFSAIRVRAYDKYGNPIGKAGAGVSSASSTKGTIGGPPSTPLAAPDQGKQMTPALVIGQGKLFGHPVEIAGAGWSAPRYFETPGGGQLCVWIEYLSEGSTSSTCGPVAQRASGKEAIHIESFWEGMGTKSPREVELSGSLAADIASVRVSFRRRGSEQIFRTSAVVAPVSGELQERLKQPAPFGYFVVKMHGKVIASSLRCRAFDHEGNFVGASHGVTRISFPESIR